MTTYRLFADKLYQPTDESPRTICLACFRREEDANAALAAIQAGESGISFFVDAHEGELALCEVGTSPDYGPIPAI